MQPAFWRSALQKGRLTTLLSGLTFAPSTLKIGLESMRLSEDSPARISALPESRLELSKAIEVDSGLNSPAPFAKHGPESSSWRTSQGCLVTETWDEFLETWPKWGSMRNGACSARRSAAPATGESGCSFWPTANVPNGGRKLSEEDTLSRGATQNGKRQVGLQNAAEFWRTPDTPGAGGPRNRQDSIGNGHQVTIAEQAEHWPTPATRDWKGDNSELHVTETGGGRKHMDQLPNFVTHHFQSFHPDPTTMSNGRKSSSDGPNSRLLWPTAIAEDSESCGNHPGATVVGYFQVHPSFWAVLVRLHSFASRIRTTSSASQTLSVTPAAIAGVTRRVW